MRISAALVRLQDTTAQIRVRGAFVLLAGFVVLAQQFGLEAILGAFIAGAVLKLVDTDRAMTHPQFHAKLAAAGFGVFVPFFFVTSGVRFNLDALFASGSTISITDCCPGDSRCSLWESSPARFGRISRGAGSGRGRRGRSGR